MQTVFTELSDNAEILNNSQKIRLILQKVQNPIITQIKASLQFSNDMEQANTVAYEFISNSLISEAASLGDHTPKELRVSILVARNNERAASRGEVAQYSPGFTPIGPSYRME